MTRPAWCLTAIVGKAFHGHITFMDRLSITADGVVQLLFDMVRESSKGQ